MYRAVGKVYEDFDIGFKFQSEGRTVNTEDLTLFAGLSGDFNRIHTDEAFAKEHSEPFRTRIAHGLLSFAISEGLLLRRGFFDGMEEAQFVELKDLKFSAPVFPGDTISVEFEIIGMRDSDNPNYGIITVRRTATNQKGETVLTAETAGRKRRAKPVRSMAAKEEPVEPKSDTDEPTWKTPSQTFTETDLVMFSNIFLTPTLSGKAKQAHITLLLPAMDGLIGCIGLPDEQAARYREEIRKLVGDRPRSGGASLGWTNLEVWASVVPGDTIHGEIGPPKMRASKGKPGMVITARRYTIVNHKEEKVLAVDHITGSW